MKDRSKRAHRRFTAEQKLEILREADQPGVTTSAVCRRHGLALSVFYRGHAVAQGGSVVALKRDARRSPRKDDRLCRHVSRNPKWVRPIFWSEQWRQRCLRRRTVRPMTGCRIDAFYFVCAGIPPPAPTKSAAARKGRERMPPPEESQRQATRGRIKRPKARNLLERLRDFEDDVLRFMGERDVPFTNNQGENDLRMTKVQQKISGCFRSFEGAQIFCRVRSYLSTCRKQGLTASEALTLLFQGTRPDFMTQDKS